MRALEILKLCQAVDDLNTRPIIRDIQNAVIEVMQLEQRNAELEQRLNEQIKLNALLNSTLQKEPIACGECKNNYKNI